MIAVHSSTPANGRTVLTLTIGPLQTEPPTPPGAAIEVVKRAPMAKAQTIEQGTRGGRQ